MKLRTLYLPENVEITHVESIEDIDGITDTIDVINNVKLNNKFAKKIPARFGKVGGDFYCNFNILTSLKDSPREVGGSFSCSNNNLTSLEGCPSKVGGNFYCTGNKLTSLVSIHKLIKKMNGTFYVHNNYIKEGGIGLLLIDGITKIYADQPALKIINKYLSQGKMGILACQEELIEAGYEDFAKL